MDSTEPAEDGFAMLQAQTSKINRAFQSYLDKVSPYPFERWTAAFVLLFLFGLRIVLVQAWYIVAYTLGIYLLNLFLAFLSPKFDPAEHMKEASEAENGGTLPTRNDEEFRPFIRRLPEFQFWCFFTRAVLIALVASLFTIFDLPVFWPVLVVYWLILFFLTMRRQIQHMVKYRYIPFDLGKTRY